MSSQPLETQQVGRRAGIQYHNAVIACANKLAEEECPYGRPDISEPVNLEGCTCKKHSIATGANGRLGFFVLQFSGMEMRP